jgi:predicted lactoylglutathione lyase
MEKQFWINLPVKDVPKSREFFTKLGFSFNQRFANSNDLACLIIGDQKVVVMLFTEPAFKSFTRAEIADTKQTSEVLLSIDAESREEVDEMARKAEEAGGIVFGKPSENQGWMYGCGFADLDGHRWNILYRDMSKMPQQ